VKYDSENYSIKKKQLVPTFIRKKNPHQTIFVEISNSCPFYLNSDVITCATPPPSILTTTSNSTLIIFGKLQFAQKINNWVFLVISFHKLDPTKTL